MKKNETIDEKINTLRLIRITKQLKLKEIADYFGVTTAYINANETGKRNMKLQTLKYGLDNLGIPLEKYQELEEYQKYVKELNISDDDRYTMMLIKTISITTSTLEKEAEKTLSALENRINNGLTIKGEPKEETKLPKKK